jgi:hypothetical protein
VQVRQNGGKEYANRKLALFVAALISSFVFMDPCDGLRMNRHCKTCGSSIKTPHGHPCPYCNERTQMGDEIPSRWEVTSHWRKVRNRHDVW